VNAAGSVAGWFRSMASNDTPTPDLATILKTLAALGPQAHIPTPQPQIQPPQIQATPLYPPQQQWTPAPAPIPQDTYRSTTPPGLPPPQKNLIDPATIIEWSAGLRCVMKTVAKHDNILLDIRRVRLTKTSRCHCIAANMK
jgi:hypothetical protein